MVNLNPPPAGKKGVAVGRRIAAAVAVLSVAAAMPVISYELAVRSLPSDARAAADCAWKSHSVRAMDWNYGPWKVCSLPSRLQLAEWLEPTTGVNLRMTFGPYWPWRYPHRAAVRRAFYAELARLMRRHGVPAWSHKTALLPRGDVLHLLTAPGFTTVTEFPRAINRYLTIAGNQQIKEAPRPCHFWFPPSASAPPIAFKILSHDHDDIAVRRGPRQLAVFSSDGELLYTVFPPTDEQP
jgi:hypothetical protein